MSHPLQQDPEQTQPQASAMEEAADNSPNFVVIEVPRCRECPKLCTTPAAYANHIKTHQKKEEETQDPLKKGGRSARPTKETRKKRKTPEAPVAQLTANCVITNGELTSISIDPPHGCGCGWDWEVTTPPSYGFMPTTECAHSLKLLVGNKLLTFTPQPGSSSSQLLCRFTWNSPMRAQGADREALKQEPHADDSSTRVPFHQVTSADESGGSDELDIYEGWESDVSDTSDDSDASDISDSDESDTGDRDTSDTSDTRDESDASTTSNSREELANNSESGTVAGPTTTPLPTCPAAAHPDDLYLDLPSLPPVHDLCEENEADADADADVDADADADADADDAAQRRWHVQEGSDDRLSTTSTSDGDQERDDDKMIASQIEAELTYLRKQRRKYGRHELRLTCVGPRKAGKTTVVASSRAALQDEVVIVPPHLGTMVHGNCLDSYTTGLLGAELRVVCQDPGADIVSLLGDLLYRRPRLRRVEADAWDAGDFSGQDALLLVVGANRLKKNALRCFATISKKLARDHRLYFIVLTKVDLLPEGTTVEAAIEKVEEATGTNRAFIFPMTNTIENWKKLPAQTTLQTLRLYSAILRHSRRGYQASCAEALKLVMLKKASWAEALKLVMLLFVLVVTVLSSDGARKLLR